MRTYAFIFARGGSKGLPGKNIRHLIGKPLIAHSLIIASQVKEIEQTFVSTDSVQIGSIAESYGATVIERPIELAQDDSPEWLAWRHAVRWVREQVGDFDRFVSLPATAPMRLEEDVRSSLKALNSETDAVVTITPSNRSPWFNMLRTDNNGRLTILLESNVDITRRQDAPKVYDLTTLAYVVRPDFIMSHDNIWQGRVCGILIPQERALDIDSEYDFKIAEYLMAERTTVERKYVK